MSIHIIQGKPGSGKSLYATSRVIEELREGVRNIVTNLPLHPGRLNEYLQQKWPDQDCRMIQRLRVLTDDELREFWKFRGPDGAADAHGVAYFLDEAHIAFNARDWATIGRGALNYLSQHRKLGDIVWVITQAPGNLDKQFRSVAEDFTALRNEYTAKFGPFRGRGRFVRRTYLQEPQQNSEPFETATFILDKEGIASCYDTARGIGVHGNKADIGRRAKGIPIWTVIPLALVVAVSCVFIPLALGRGVNRYVTGKVPAGAGAKVAPVRTDAEAPSAAVPGGTDRKPVAEPTSPKLDALPVDAKPTPSTAVWVTGYVVRAGKVNVTLSDGRTLSEHDGILSRVTRTFVETKQGERIWLQRPAVAPKAQPAPAVQVVPAADKSPQVTEAPVRPEENGSSWVTGSDGVSRLKPEAPRTESSSFRSTVTTTNRR